MQIRPKPGGILSATDLQKENCPLLAVDKSLQVDS